MISNNIYEAFFSSSFLSEYRRLGVTITDFFDFVNTFLGVENFIHNHPKPVIEYYWQLKGGEGIRQIAKRFGVTLKKPKFINVGDWHFGSAVSLILAVLVIVLMGLINKVEKYAGYQEETKREKTKKL